MSSLLFSWQLRLLSFDFRNVSKTVRETIYYPYDYFIPFVPGVEVANNADLKHPCVTVQSPSNNFQVNAYVSFPSREMILIRARSPISWPMSYYIMYTRHCLLRFSTQYPVQRMPPRCKTLVLGHSCRNRMHREHDDAINNTRVQ